MMSSFINKNCSEADNELKQTKVVAVLEVISNQNPWCTNTKMYCIFIKKILRDHQQQPSRTGTEERSIKDDY